MQVFCGRYTVITVVDILKDPSLVVWTLYTPTKVDTFWRSKLASMAMHTEILICFLEMQDLLTSKIFCHQTLDIKIKNFGSRGSNTAHCSLMDGLNNSLSMNFLSMYQILSNTPKQYSFLHVQIIGQSQQPRKLVSQIQ